ncbi:permease [Cellulophaga baltica]|uniref:AEC family transporter n=1 Tax=Cellulophaga TaxID=104264 RepID=UPI001C07AF37|nr:MULTISPECIES: permease [Cellulophaga]MBU2995268.1 permease [Cellulophaga baltica]MDO6766663.1 permease [Cellulophaga sp. 1_MG-2023]
MNIAFQKTLELLLIIAVGVFLQKKVAKNDLKGVKVVILSVALPAVIFVALLKIKLESSLLIFPVLALAFNLLMLLASKYYLSTVLPSGDNARKRTIMMLLPSLAPGLSCFPFIVVYLGDDHLALAALADVGNKIFVLILLYMLAMHWYNIRSIKKEKKSMNKKIKGLLISMINEPINLVMIIALVLLGFGFTLSSLPNFLGNTITKLSAIMAPLVLLFIGMAVRINANEFGLILSLLARRAGITFLLSAIFVFLFPALGASMILFLIVFPQSSCSFWPFAHMSAISVLEEKDDQKKPTFDIDFAVNVLACSLPFSTLLIIGIFSFSEIFVDPVVILTTGVSILLLSYIPNAIRAFKKAKTHSDKHIDAMSLNLEAQTNEND